MNINFCLLHYADESFDVVVVCPTCHSNQCSKHGFYLRKGFHTQNKSMSHPILIQRHRCLNPECKRRTFSVLPPMVLRYCRFFWPCLLAIWNALTHLSMYHIARIWNVDRRVIAGVYALQSTIHGWVAQQHQELTNGSKTRILPLMVKIIFYKMGPAELMNRWYCYRYPKRSVFTL
jgi:hypothetical protein